MYMFDYDLVILIDSNLLVQVHLCLITRGGLNLDSVLANIWHSLLYISIFFSL